MYRSVVPGGWEEREPAAVQTLLPPPPMPTQSHAASTQPGPPRCSAKLKTTTPFSESKLCTLVLLTRHTVTWAKPKAANLFLLACCTAGTDTSLDARRDSDARTQQPVQHRQARRFLLLTCEACWGAGPVSAKRALLQHPFADTPALPLHQSPGPANSNPVNANPPPVAGAGPLGPGSILKSPVPRLDLYLAQPSSTKSKVHDDSRRMPLKLTTSSPWGCPADQPAHINAVLHFGKQLAPSCRTHTLPPS